MISNRKCLALTIDCFCLPPTPTPSNKPLDIDWLSVVKLPVLQPIKYRPDIFGCNHVVTRQAGWVSFITAR